MKATMNNSFSLHMGRVGVGLMLLCATAMRSRLLPIMRRTPAM